MGDEGIRMFDDIRNELIRLNAADVQLEVDERRSAEEGPHVKIRIGQRSCSVQVAGLITMLHSLPDSAGEAAIEAAIESEASHAEGWATC
jgi:hypothetical protein